MSGLLRLALIVLATVVVLPFTASASVYSARGTFNAATVAGNQAITVGFQPKAVIFYWAHGTADGYQTGGYLGYGFTDGTRQGVVAVASDDGVGTSNIGSMTRTDSVISILSNGAPTEDARANIVSLDANGFTLNWSNAAGSAWNIHYLAVGGTEITNAYVGSFSRTAGTGNLAVTGTGFQPDFVMMLAPEYTDALNATSTGAAFSIGMMTPTEQQTLGFGLHQDGQTTARINSGRQITTAALSTMYRGTEDGQASYASMDANGFTLNWTNGPAGTVQVLYLALKGGGYDLGATNQRTSVGTTAVTGVPFRPAGVMLFSYNNAASATVNTGTGAGKISIGASTVTSEGAVWMHDTDNVTTTDANRATITTKAIRLATNATTTNAEADVNSFDANGFTLGWTTTDATARQVLYWTFGSTCVDADPSTITIPAGQTINGSPYSLAGKYSTTGDVASLENKVTYTASGAPTVKTYFMTRDTTTNLGADGTCDVTGTGTYLAADGAGNTTTATTEFGTGSRFYPNITASTNDRALDVYTPVYANAVNISNISVATALRGLAATDTVKIDLYAYNPAGAAGNGTLVATGATKTLTSGTTTFGYTWAATDFTLNGSGTVPAGYRLQFRYTWTSGTTGTPRVYFGIAGGLTSTSFTVTETPAETTCTDWTASTSIPATTAGGSLCGNYLDGGSYKLSVRGTDPDCGDIVLATPTNFTWQSCAETATVNVTDPGVITGPTAITVTVGGTGGSNPQWSPNGGANWYNSGSVYTPPTCATGSVTFTGRATGSCGTITDATPVAGSYDTTDADLATLTVTGPASPVTGIKTVQVQVGTETAPDALSAVVVDITGSSACNVNNGFMNWNGATSRWEYSWDTSACGTGAVEAGVSIVAQATDPDCNNTVTSPAATVTIDNTCIDNTTTVTWTVPATPITVPTAITATGSAGVTAIEVSFDDGSTWQANGSTYTPKVDQLGTSVFRLRALDACGKRIYGGTRVEGATFPGKAYNVDFDGRLNRIRPLKITATAVGKTSIKIELSYCSDKNDNASTTVRYKLTSAPDLPANWTTVGPYVDGADADGLRNQLVLFMLTGLTTDTSYDIEMTIAETAPDVVDWSTIQLTQATAPPWKGTVQLTSWLDSNLMHNALRFACSKIGFANQQDCIDAGGTWNLDRKWTGGWGLPNATYPNAQYDSFECGTCHVKNSSNVKRVITAVTPKADGPFPGSAVSLQDVREGTAQFGDDSDNHTTSNRVCEVCHSQTTYHRQDTSGQTNKLHNNKTDCIRCHEHKVGFRASCDSCHGTPPVDISGLASDPVPTGSTVWGEHQKHAVDIGYDCNTCHNGWDGANQMPNTGNLNIGFKPSVNPQFNGAVNNIFGGTYEGRTTGGGYTGDTSTTPATVVNTATGTMTCATYCHGYGRPVWNPISSQPCGSCHGKVNSGVGYQSGAPTGVNGSKDLAGLTSGLQVGKHAVHLDDSVAQTGDPCALCHSGFGYTDSTHVNGTVNVLLRQAAKIEGSGTTGGAGINAVYNPATGQCTNMECHGNTPWNSTAVLNCTQSCHNYPPVGVTAGLSIYPTTTPVSHDTRGDGGAYLKANHKGCLYCHGWNDNGSGSLPITGATAAQITVFGGDPAEAPNFTTYSAATNPIGQHMDGKITMNDDGDGNSANDADYDPATGGCDNAVCHPNDATHRLNISGGANLEVQADIGPGDCAECHDTGVGGATVVTGASAHTKATYNGTFTKCTVCHSGHYTKAGGVKIPNNPTVGINYAGTQHGGINLGGPGTHASIENKTTEAEICWGCHDAMGTANVKKATITFTANTIVDSGAGLGVFTVGKPLKVMGSSVVANNKWVTPTAVAAGTLTFPAATFTADATAGEMITLQDFVSEWGGNTAQTGTPAQAQYQYNYGSLSTSNWTTATWSSGQAKFAYKTAKIQSTHAANSIEAGATSAVTGSVYAYKEAVDDVALIRCSYCHDVHNAVGPNGPPYLRGTWWGNPYEEDGAPQAATAYSNTAPFGAVPRGNGANQSYIGGFFIDINNVRPGSAGATANGTASVNPTATGGTGTGGAWTLADSAGLCVLCHGNNPSTMNWNTTETNLWFSANGHANSVIGGTGNVPAGTAANVFNLRGGTASTTGAVLNAVMHYYGTSSAPGDNGNYGFRNGTNSGYAYTPSLSSVSENNEITTPTTNRWGTVTIDAATINSQYHKFSCSKCHNPHASRLPKLMITNCLDTKHNTWDDSYQLNAATGINLNRSISNWSTAQNCHRVGGIIPATRVIPGDPATGGPAGNGLYAEPVDASAVAAPAGTGTDYANRGWNTVTPW